MREFLKFKKIIIGAILISLIFVTLEPLTASAQNVGSILLNSGECVGAGFAATFITGLIEKGLNSLIGLLPNTIKSWFGLADEVPTHNQKQWTKENVLDLIARCGARAVLNDMTHRMIGAVRTSGRDGKASFVTDWRRFLAGSQYRGENIFRSMLASTTLCPHISNDLKRLYGAIYQPSVNSTLNRFGNYNDYSLRARCTFPTGWNLLNYIDDFTGYGGWNTLVQLSQPQNNFYGSLLMSMSESGTQRAQSQAEDILESLSGGGFTSRRANNATTQAYRVGYCSNDFTVSCFNDTPCLGLPDQGTGRACIIPRDSCFIRGLNDQCLVYENILTPGSTLSQSVSAVIDNEMAWVTNVDEIQELIMALTDVLLRRVLNLSKPDVTQQEPFIREPGGNLAGDPEFSGNLPGPGQITPAPTPTPIPGACFPPLNGFCDVNLGESYPACSECAPANTCQPTCNASDDRLSPGETLPPDGRINSQNGRFTLVLQGSNGNLVIYDNSTNPATVLWSAFGSSINPGSNPGDLLEMNTDGRLVMYNQQPNLAWVINTSSPGAYLVVQDDGNVVLFSSGGTPQFTLNSL